MLKKSTFWFLLSMLAIASACSDEDNYSNIPEHIVYFDRFGYVYNLNTQTKASSQVDFHEVFGESVPTIYLSRKYADNTMEFAFRMSNEYDIVSYNPYNDQLEIERISDPNEDSPNIIELSSDYMVCWQEFPRGAAYPGFQLHIFDRNQKSWKELLLCDSCESSTSNHSVLIRDKTLYVQTRRIEQTTRDYINILTVLDLETLEILDEMELGTTITQVFLKDEFLDSYNYPEVSRYKLSGLKFWFKKELEVGMPLGVYSYSAQKIPVLVNPTVQPSFSKELAIMDVTSLKVIKNFPITFITKAREHFVDKMNIENVYSSNILSIDTRTQFLLWEYNEPINSTGSVRYGFIFSDFTGGYNGHIELPSEPRSVYLF